MNNVLRSAAVVVAGLATSAHAQLVPPVLRIDFVTSAVPLSPVLTVLIALAVAAVALYALGRRRARGTLLSWLAIGLVALPAAWLVAQTHFISDARAVYPTYDLPLVTSPATISSIDVGIFEATNRTGAPVVLTAVNFNPGGYNYYVSEPETTCTANLTLLPGQACVVFIRSTG